MTRSIRSLIIVVTVGAMVLLLAACGNTTTSNNEANESNETSEASEVSEAVASPEATEMVAAEATSEATEMPMAEATSEMAESTEMPMAEATSEASTDVMSEDSVDNGADEASEMSMAEATSETTLTCALLNLNTATQDELMNSLPDFSDAMANTVIENRPYDSIQQFSSDMGKSADKTQISTWETYLYVPVDPNNSDAATLQQLPGVDETIANTLIDARPYADQQAFMDKLSSLVSAEQFAQADCYFGS